MNRKEIMNLVHKTLTDFAVNLGINSKHHMFSDLINVSVSIYESSTKIKDKGMLAGYHRENKQLIFFLDVAEIMGVGYEEAVRHEVTHHVQSLFVDGKLKHDRVFRQLSKVIGATGKATQDVTAEQFKKIKELRSKK